MRPKLVRDIHRASVLIFALAALFCLFFQAGKMDPFRAINPFGGDSFDAVGSISIQVALFVSILTYARALRLREEPLLAAKSARHILRGNIVVLSAVAITLISDGTAAFLYPAAPTLWAHLLVSGIGLLLVPVLLCAFVLAAAFQPVARVSVPSNLTIMDGVEDLWALVRIPARRFRALLPRKLVEEIERFHPEALLARFPWLNPRIHPWRFALLLGIWAGFCLLVAQAQEGPPPNIGAGLLVAGLFLSMETAATLLGYLILGRYLGLRASPTKAPLAIDPSALRLRF